MITQIGAGKSDAARRRHVPHGTSTHHCATIRRVTRRGSARRMRALDQHVPDPRTTGAASVEDSE